MIHTLTLWIIRGSAIYHLVMGLASMLSLRWIAWLASQLYALKVPTTLDPRLEYGLKPLGAFAFTLAIWCTQVGWFAQSPLEVEVLSAALAILFILRGGFRFFYSDLFERGSGVPWSRSRWNVAFNLGLSTILLGSMFG